MKLTYLPGFGSIIRKVKERMMTREEILAVTESDSKGCTTINRLVHKKLGHCWHEWPERDMGYQVLQVQGDCTKCGHSRYTFFREIVRNPDYTHDIKAVWAIKEWLDSVRSWTADGDLQRNKRYQKNLVDICYPALYTSWASPLDRCKAFLLMDEVKE